MIEVIKSSFNLGQAIDESLVALDATFSQVDIQVLEHGLFKKTKVKVVLNDEEQKKRGLQKERPAMPNPSPITPEPKVASAVSTQRVVQSQPLVEQPKQQTELSKPTTPKVVAQQNAAQLELNPPLLQATKPLSHEDNTVSNYTDKKTKTIDPNRTQQNQNKTRQERASSNKGDTIAKNNKPNREQYPKAKPENKFVATDDDLKKLQDEIVQSFLAAPKGEIVTHGVGDFLLDLIQKMGVYDTKIVCRLDDRTLYVDIETSDIAIVGFKGEVIWAFELLVSMIQKSKQEQDPIKVIVENHNYKIKKLDSIRLLTTRTVDKVLKIGKKIKLEPMSDVNRKFVHQLLSVDKRVFAKSEGVCNSRCVVIFPAIRQSDR